MSRPAWNIRERMKMDKRGRGEKLNFLDCFSGIGGFRLAFEKAGHKCVGHIEKDKYARQSYEAIFNTEGELINATDITKVSDEAFKKLRGKVDIVLGGFPCQAFSIAGHQRGFEDSRGTLFFDIARAIKQIKPPIFLLENVKGLLSHDEGQTFEIILKTLDELGYDVEWQLLNSADFGVPQNRERVFIIGHLRGTGGRKIFPIKQCGNENSTRGAEQVNIITARYGEASGAGSYIVESRKVQEIKFLGGKSQGNRIYDSSGLSVTISSQGGGRGAKTGLYAIPVLTPNRENKRQNGRRCKDDGEDMFILTAQDIHGVIIQRPRGNNKGGVHTKVSPTLTSSGFHQNNLLYDNFVIRRLTPRECWRLQGFPDWAFNKAKESGISDSQLYKQAGNAVTVNVVYEIARRLVK